MSPRLTKENAETIERMAEGGYPTREIADLIGKSQRTVQRYIQYHMPETEGGPWLPFDMLKLDLESKNYRREQAVMEILENDPTLTQMQMIERMPDDLKCSRSTLKLVIAGMKYTRKRLRKRPYERNDPDTKKARKNYGREVMRIPNDKLFFFDETGLNLHHGPAFGYAPVGTSISVDQPGDRGKSVSIIGCIGESGLVHYEYVDGAYNSVRVKTFLDNMLPKLPLGSTVVMDNAVVHKSNLVLQTYKAHNLDYKFLSRYSPQLNPIENFWSIMEARQSRMRPRPRTRDASKESVDKVMNELYSYRCDNLFKHMRDWVKTAIANEDFP